MHKSLSLLLFFLGSSALAAGKAAAPCDVLRSPFASETSGILYASDSMLPQLPDAVLAKASEACEQALASDPGNPRLLYQTGMAHYLLAHQAAMRHLASGEKQPHGEQALADSARRHWQRAADQGDATAAYWLARWQLGKVHGRDRDKAKAAFHALLATDALIGHLGLGYWYQTVDGADDSHRTAALAHYRQAAALGSRIGEHQAILITLSDPATQASALAALEALAHSGDLPALESLGEYHLRQQDEQALAAVLATLGQDARPEAAVIAAYLQGIALANSADAADREEGQTHLQAAARQGHLRAQTMLAVQSVPWWE